MIIMVCNGLVLYFTVIPRPYKQSTDLIKTHRLIMIWPRFNQF